MLLTKPMRQKFEAKAAQLEAKARAIRAAIAILSEDDRAKARDAMPGKLAKAIQQTAPPKGKKAGPYTNATKAQRRTQTQKFLAQFDGATPTSAAKALAAVGLAGGRGRASGGLGTLVRHGYLKPKGDGYVRTARPFHVTPPASSNGHTTAH